MLLFLPCLLLRLAKYHSKGLTQAKGNKDGCMTNQGDAMAASENKISVSIRGTLK
jgi:hypothetical protein